MTWVATAIVGSSLIGGYFSSQGAQNAANTQAQAGLQAQQQVLAAGQKASENYLPYQQLGQTGVNALNQQMPYLTSQFSNADLNSQLAPNYAFQLQQGQQSTNAANNATGGMVGGNALQGLNTFSQNYAQGAYQNAFNNYQAQQTNIYNKLAGIAGIGMAGATGAANAQIGTGTNVANITQGIGNAQAAGQIGQANAISGAVGNVGNAGALYGMNQSNANPLSNMGLLGNNSSGYTYANPGSVGPPNPGITGPFEIA